jgi:hypothetical protein
MRNILDTAKRSVVAAIVFVTTIAGLSIAYSAYSGLSAVTSGQPLTVGMWAQLKDNFTDHETRIAAVEAKPASEVSATFIGGLANGDSAVGNIVATNGGYASFAALQNSNPAVFEVVTTGQFGIKINKPGRIMWNYQQDIITTAGSYPWLYSSVDGTVVVYSLISPTGGLWDMIHNQGAYNVTAGQTLKFQFGCSGCTITGLNNGAWGRIAIFWMGQP